MRYNLLGRSGLAVSELCLGTMTFGGSEGMWGLIGQLQQDEADALVKAAGLRPAREERTFIWRVVLYERPGQPA